MTLSTQKRITCIALGTIFLASTATYAQQEEFENRGPYYEDDAWYDISEWFDGNDYNPTDESIWRWDDETYDFHQDNGTDWDNDVYGYYDNNQSDWFYDYYDDDYLTYADHDFNNIVEYTTHYIDVDNDGYIDAYYTFLDSDGDGTYDRVSYRSFNSSGESSSSGTRSNLSDSDVWKQRSTPATTRGEVTNTKTVTVRDSKHQIVQLKTDKDKKLVVDLGSADEARQWNISKGDTITVNGFNSQVGDKMLVIAKSVNVDGKTREISRNGREFTGKIKSTHQTKLNGHEHTFAMVDAKNNKQCVVDLGPSDKLPMTVREGQQITITGVPIKVNDKTMVMATQIKDNGKMRDIARRPDADNSSMHSNRDDKNDNSSSMNRKGR